MWARMRVFQNEKSFSSNTGGRKGTVESLQRAGDSPPYLGLRTEIGIMIKSMIMS